jgi:hypothetical protein
MEIGAVLTEVRDLNTDLIRQVPAAFANLLQQLVHDGSQVHLLSKSDLVVYANTEDDYAGKEEHQVQLFDKRPVPTTLKGLMANGVKFLDAVIWLSLRDQDRPGPKERPMRKDPKSRYEWPVHNDVGRITKFIFVVYFFIMIRGHAPTDTGDYKDQPMPKFISNVLGISEPTREIAEYLADFPLNNMDPSWVRHISVKGLSQEAVSRFGLGVAGYRIVSVFNVVAPDLYQDPEKEDGKEVHDNEAKPLSKKPAWLDAAVEVARSFHKAGVCWDFHPATRSANVLSKYGNINKNAANLILRCYKPSTIQSLVSTKKLAQMPREDPAHTNYQNWTLAMQYKATAKAFK